MTRPGFELSRRAAMAGLAGTGGAAAVIPWLMSIARAVSSPTHVVTAEQFGATGDGATDDAPALNRALAALTQGGGGTLRLRRGATYALGSFVASSGLTHASYRASVCFPAGARNITLDLNGATLLQTSDSYSIGTAYRLFNDRALSKLVLPVRGAPSRGDAVIQVRAGVASRLRAGGSYMMLASNTVPAPGAYAPVAEMVTVLRVEGTRVVLDRPLRKMYRAQVGVPLGLLDLSEMMMRDIAIIGPGRIVNTYRRCGNMLQVMGFHMEGVTCVGRGGMAVRGRDVMITDCAAEIQADWTAPLYRPYCLALDTGTSDAVIRNFKATGGTNVTYLHLHEGLADVQVLGIDIRNGTQQMPGGENVGAIDILSGSWNITVQDATVANNPQGPAIMARTTQLPVGGNHNLVLRRIRMAGVFKQGPLVLIDSNAATLDGIDMCNARTKRPTPLVQPRGANALAQGFVPCGIGATPAS